MLKRLLYLLIVFVILGNDLIAQPGFQPLYWGGEIFKPASGTTFHTIGNWNEGILLQSKTSPKIFSSGKTFIQRVDNMTLLPQYTKELKLESSKGNKPLEYQVMTRMGENPVLFATYFNKDKNKIELYGRKYDLEGEPIEKDKKIAEFSATRKQQIEAMNFISSEDSLSMLTYFSEKFEQYENEKIDFHLFDKNLIERWNRNIEFPYKGKNFSIFRVKVDNNGRVFLLVKVYKENEKQKRLANFRFGLVTFSQDTSLVEDYGIELENNVINDIDFNIDSLGNVICGGLYSKVELNNSSGSFFIKIDRSQKKITDQVLTPFEAEFAAQFNDDSRGRNRSELSDFKMDHFIHFKDGSYAMVAEQYIFDQVCYTDFRTGMVSCTNYYYYNNIVVVKMLPNGEVEWAANIPKFQETVNDFGIYSSYAFGVSGNSMYFVFNENESNLTISNQKDMQAMTKIRSASIVVCKLSSNGSFSRKATSSDKKKSSFYFIPENASQISENSLLLMSFSNNKFRLGVLPLE
jgi:hypothetical protein